MNFANEKVKEAWMLGRDDALRGMLVSERLNSTYRTKPEEAKAYSMGYQHGVQIKCEQTIKEVERA